MRSAILTFKNVKYSKTSKIRTSIFRNTDSKQTGDILNSEIRTYSRSILITYVLGALKKRLIETFLLRAQNLCLIDIYLYVYLPIIRNTDSSK